jgi:glycosyltransferase involved in cell wall biosynthesis
MKVQSLLYPFIEVRLPSGNYAKFMNGIAEMPDSDALVLAQQHEQYRIIGSDNLKDGKVAFNPASWRDGRKLIWDSTFYYKDGYGKCARAFVQDLNKLVDIYPLSFDQSVIATESNPDFVKIFSKKLDSADTFAIKMSPGQNITKTNIERQIAFTMFETDKIRPEWVENLNRNVERVLVPCQQNKEAFEASGVKRDIAVIPLGINETYSYIDREDSEEFVFGTMGNLTYRKGTDLLVKAFEKLFLNKHPEVKLVIKTSSMAGITNASFIFGHNPELLHHPQIKFIQLDYTEKELREVFELIDCFVFPTRGEGFGLPPLEAMGTGLPVICTNWSGCADFLDDRYTLPLNYKLVETPSDPDDSRGFGPILTTPGMKWAEPDFDDLCDKMLFAYNNRAKMKAMGKKASAYAHKNWSYAKAAQKLVNYLDEKF